VAISDRMSLVLYDFGRCVRAGAFFGLDGVAYVALPSAALAHSFPWAFVGLVAALAAQFLRVVLAFKARLDRERLNVRLRASYGLRAAGGGTAR
jgi:hypothetical protein